MKKSILLVLILSIALSGVVFAGGGAEEEVSEPEPIRLVGATQLPAEYVFYRTMVRFADLVQEYYDGDVPVEISVHHSGELGTEKDYAEYMIQGMSVDFAVVAPSWVATWDKRVSFMDPPFLWRDIDHWNKGLSSGAFDEISETLCEKGLRVLGYGGGGTRNLILREPVATMEDLPDVLLRVMGSPIQARVFGAIGMQPTPMNYLEVYNGIKTGVVDGLENEAASLMSMKFYEVAPNIILTRHAITVRPLFFSEKRFQELPADLQAAILRAGEEATAWHRETEVKEDAQALKDMEAQGLITLHEFPRDEMRALALPELEAFAAELDATGIWEEVQAIR